MADGTQESYTYDHEGQRIKKQAGDGSYIMYYGTLFDELYSSGNSLLKQTLYIYAGNQRVAMKDSSGNAYYIHADHLGSTHLMTNATTGSVVRTNKYLPYGGTFETSGTADDTHKYTGQVLDDNTGLYYYNARYYDPQLCTFISPDSVVQSQYDPQSLNRYSYCRNNPINNTDPTGHRMEPMFDDYGGGYSYSSRLDLSWRNSSIGNAFNTGWNYFAGNIVEPGINRFIENREQRLAEGRNLSFYSYSKLGLFERDAYDAAIGFMGGISVVGRTAGIATKIGGEIADEAVSGLKGIAKATEGQKKVVIGETMTRVKAYAKEIGADYYKAWKMTPYDEAKALARNENWIQGKMSQNYTIYDIGIDQSRAFRSKAYELETSLTGDYTNLIRIKK